MYASEFTTLVPIAEARRESDTNSGQLSRVGSVNRPSSNSLRSVQEINTPDATQKCSEVQSPTDSLCISPLNSLQDDTALPVPTPYSRQANNINAVQVSNTSRLQAAVVDDHEEDRYDTVTSKEKPKMPNTVKPGFNRTKLMEKNNNQKNKYESCAPEDTIQGDMNRFLELVAKASAQVETLETAVAKEMKTNAKTSLHMNQLGVQLRDMTMSQTNLQRKMEINSTRSEKSVQQSQTQARRESKILEDRAQQAVAKCSVMDDSLQSKNQQIEALKNQVASLEQQLQEIASTTEQKTLAKIQNKIGMQAPTMDAVLDQLKIHLDGNPLPTSTASNSIAIRELKNYLKQVCKIMNDASEHSQPTITLNEMFTQISNLASAALQNDGPVVNFRFHHEHMIVRKDSIQTRNQKFQKLIQEQIKQLERKRSTDSSSLPPMEYENQCIQKIQAISSYFSSNF